jgi:lipoprotein-anchoring transpeptidase ErfK/SrfK
MATTFKNALSPAIGTTQTIVYTASSNVRTTVLGISLANVTSSFVTASVIVTDPGPTGTFTGTFTNNSPTITNVSTFSEIQVGSSITSVGYILALTTISSFNASAGTITMSQNATSAGSNITVNFTDANPVSAYYISNVIIPPNQSLRVINGGERLVLGGSNTLSIVSNTAASLDAIVSLVEIV